MAKCKIQWIDRQGVPTPDQCDATYMAVCTFEDGSKCPPIPCCEHHYQRGIFFSNWNFTPIVIGANT